MFEEKSVKQKLYSPEILGTLTSHYDFIFLESANTEIEGIGKCHKYNDENDLAEIPLWDIM